jgi:hypothetical protein
MGYGLRVIGGGILGLGGVFNRMTEDNLHTKVDLENGSPDFAKPVLPAVGNV